MKTNTIFFSCTNLPRAISVDGYLYWSSATKRNAVVEEWTEQEHKKH